ncbi:DNA repair protein rhp41 [Plectosphaerella plurivora]|uniref:DNA repair protein rhp41 n=1 Tax=Plectosphaerella plurivora TaxID=936078 RepID=A0A9P8V7I3_9PEZI|nr:DNA repair protein rhp41 [Plectosphaerella plurivora]
MAGQKRKAPRRTAAASALPGIYEDMLAEAGASPEAAPSHGRPPKRMKPGEKSKAPAKEPEIPKVPASDSEDEDIEFEDVHIPAPSVQTTILGSDDEDTEDEDIEFEDVDLAPARPTMDNALASATIELNLTAHKTSVAGKQPERRKPLSRVEKEKRVNVHKAHLLCLLIQCARRNRWCNDEKAQDALRPLLTPKILKALRPKATLNQFGMTESLKDGLTQASRVFKTKFRVTERGLRRCLWAENQELLDKYELPEDSDSCSSLEEFREGAASLQGSRDLGAQLFCAMLRSAGLECRLVCSMQPLAFVSWAPTWKPPRATKQAAPKPTSEDSLRELKGKFEAPPPVSRAASRRFGSTTTTMRPSNPTPSQASPRSRTPKPIKESNFPVYWVEVLDVAHQKWQPVDPLVTDSLWKPAKLEPPAADRENCMCYVMAFEEDGTARDVTRRYAKAYTSKTRRMRIDGVVEDGSRWWRKALKPFARKWPTDLDQIEVNELSAAEMREPMPRNVADFKDHPVYALERHLRRNEVLVPGAQPTGTVGAGSRGPLEKIYRRRDVRVARSRDKWYRMGREVKPMELPVKFLPRRANTKTGDYVDDGYGGDERDAAGTPVFMPEQTEQFRHPPVVGGRVPKNKFGNIDLYVPSMCPPGGVYIADEGDLALAARAAYILGLDYAPALTGFSFQGRQGTAILNGVVVPQEAEEAIRAVVAGLGDVEAQRESNVRAAQARRMWKRFLFALRIRERIYSGVDAEERARDEAAAVAATPPEVRGPEGGDDGEGGFEHESAEEMAEDALSDVTEEYLMDEDDLGGGGFFAE